MNQRILGFSILVVILQFNLAEAGLFDFGAKSLDLSEQKYSCVARIESRKLTSYVWEKVKDGQDVALGKTEHLGNFVEPLKFEATSERFDLPAHIEGNTNVVFAGQTKLEGVVASIRFGEYVFNEFKKPDARYSPYIFTSPEDSLQIGIYTENGSQQLDPDLGVSAKGRKGQNFITGSSELFGQYISFSCELVEK